MYSNSIYKVLSRHKTRFLTSIFLFSLFVQPMSIAHAVEPVGQVQLLIGGEANVERFGAMQELEKGSELYEGDVITTSSSSRLHIAFVDGAIAALRPNTEYHIDCYRTAGDDICLKLNLIKGEVRQVTGAAGESHKNRFRLNTPVAAIGIRGTDFITHAKGYQTLVRVLSGEIVGAPIDSSCSAGSLGACDSNFAMALKEHDNRIMLIEPNKQPNFILEDSSQILSKVKISRMNNKDSELKIHVLKDNPEIVEKYLELSNYVLENYTPEDGIVPNMVFGTWSTEGDGIALPYQVAKHNREVTIGNQNTGLWRTPLINPVVGTATFIPYQSEVSFDSATFLTEVNVLDSSRLVLDFDQSEVNAYINLLADGELISISANNEISRDDGIFTLRTDAGGNIAGAVDQDLNNAGTILTQPHNNGIINAQTLWAR